MKAYFGLRITQVYHEGIAMLKAIVGACLGTTLFAAQAFAAGGYEGTWTGHFKDGTPVVLALPAGVEGGAAASYSYNNQDQGPQTPTMQGKKIRLDNPSGSYMIVGPVHGNSLPYFWTDGSHKAMTTLMRQ